MDAPRLPPLKNNSRSWTPARRATWCIGVFAFVLLLSVLFHPIFNDGLSVCQSVFRATPTAVAAAVGIFFGSRPTRKQQSDR